MCMLCFRATRTVCLKKFQTHLISELLTYGNVQALQITAYFVEPSTSYVSNNEGRLRLKRTLFIRTTLIIRTNQKAFHSQSSHPAHHICVIISPCLRITKPRQ